MAALGHFLLVLKILHLFLLLEQCEAAENTPMDIVVLLDSSDNHHSINFQSEKVFLKDFIDRVDPENTDARLSLYTYGRTSFGQFYLDTYRTAAEMKQALVHMWFAAGNPKPEHAILTTLADAFQEIHGDRECVSNILIVIAHSKLSETDLITNVSKDLSSRIVQCIVVNMAGSAAQTTFQTLTNGTTTVLQVDDFASLASSAATVLQTVKAHIPRTGCGKYSEWEQWGRCNVKCGLGLQFRTRSCSKEDLSDRDCVGLKTEDVLCSMPHCTDPVDGKWSFWESWSVCSKSCEKGVQMRQRMCSNPAPEHGGKPCVGDTREERACADWKCPDCNKQCPFGATLKDCDFCVCTRITLYGSVMNDVKDVVQNASIFLESRRYTPIATTGSLGRFLVNGMCIVGETLWIEASGHAGKHISPTEVNSTHWTISNVTLEKYVPPVYKTHPQSKVRLVGQNVSMCCNATGRPMPSKYNWFKDGKELIGKGMDGHLTLTSLQLSDSGLYYCQVSTAAGVTLSEKAALYIEDKTGDSCGAPMPNLQKLPDGCFRSGDVTFNSSIDVGTCGQAKCINSNLQDNGSCTDFWPHHCCAVGHKQLVNIQCNGFSYKMPRLLSCVCTECRYVTTLSGRAYGRQNGIEVPLKLGEVIYRGKQIARTNMAGFFHFEIPLGIKRVVIMFSDPTFRKLLDVTKIVQVKEGKDTFFEAIMPLSPNPVPFDSTNGIELPFGEAAGLSVVGHLKIQKNSLVNSEGQPFIGNANVKIQYADPRSMDSIDEANGEFETEDKDGEIVPLRTYGVLSLRLHDDNDNELRSNKPVRISLDSDAFSIPLDSNGNPKAHIWKYDHNNGFWVDVGQLKVESTISSGARKLLQANSQYFLEMIPDDVPVTDLDEHIVTYWYRNGYTNVDSRVTVIKDSPKEGGCYVSVSVYNDVFFNEPYADNDVTITAYVYENNAFTSRASRSVLTNGHACIEMFCSKNISIVVQRGSERFIPKVNHYVPLPLDFKNTNNNFVNFVGQDFGEALDCSDTTFYKTGTAGACHGPVYRRENSRQCEAVTAQDASFMFQFAALSKPPTMHFVEGEQTFDKRLSWYSLPPSSNRFRACFIKLRVKIFENLDMRIIATSKIGDASLDDFGSVDMSAYPNPTLDESSRHIRGACIEYRCPGLVIDGGKTIYDLSTVVDVNIVLTNKTTRCKMRFANQALNITENGVGVSPGFRFISPSGMNYGPNFGVYINDDKRERVSQFCNAGNDRDPLSQYYMDPTTNAAVEFECT